MMRTKLEIADMLSDCNIYPWRKQCEAKQGSGVAEESGELIEEMEDNRLTH